MLEENSLVSINNVASSKLTIDPENNFEQIEKKSRKPRRPLATLAVQEFQQNKITKEKIKDNTKNLKKPCNDENALEASPKKYAKTENVLVQKENVNKVSSLCPGLATTKIKPAEVKIFMEDETIEENKSSKSKLNKQEHAENEDDKNIENKKSDKENEFENEVEFYLEKLAEDILLSDEVLQENDEDQENIQPDPDVSLVTDASLMSCVYEDDDPGFDRMLFIQCQEYAGDIYRYLIDSQIKYQPDPNYMSKQTCINAKMRRILISWMIDVSIEYKLHPETLFLAANFVDRFLSKLGISRQNLQLLGTTALFISCKYEEIIPPTIDEFVYITEDSYSINQVLGMEKLILKSLKFDISVPTAHFFLRKYLSEIDLPQIIGLMSEYLCFLSLLECDITCSYFPNDIAVSSILLACLICGVQLTGNNGLFNILFPNHSADKIKSELTRLQNVTESLNKCRIDIKNCKDGVFTKYSSEMCFSVALLEFSSLVPKLVGFTT